MNEASTLQSDLVESLQPTSDPRKLGPKLRVVHSRPPRPTGESRIVSDESQKEPTLEGLKLLLHAVKHLLVLRDASGELIDLNVMRRRIEDETRKDTEEKFRRLVNQWREETRFESSMMKLTNHRAYRRIAAMGLDVVPLLLRELQRDPDYWFTALADITEEDPVNPEDAGDLEKMSEAWLHWGQEHGYL